MTFSGDSRQAGPSLGIIKVDSRQGLPIGGVLARTLNFVLDEIAKLLLKVIGGVIFFLIFFLRSFFFKFIFLFHSGPLFHFA